ncbi:18.1 kDa class I heat shock protein-like [Phoenix dactylifera]|uniref:18.1 kDa class I heat shock protein-like n=1 Tax=Phoenix dactylifera TaxID=42345 RepID=A0A8B7BZK4_PHODC|nr:18.1 kDa class I heat shock protein-like [Phoenix dactylifera]
MSLSSLFGRKSAKTTNTEPPISIDIWDSLEGFSLASVMPFAAVSSFTAASTDWKETHDAHVFITDLPGVKKDEVKIEVEEEKILKISGQRTKDSEEKGEKWHHIERSAEKFLRSVKLPPNASIERMKAVLENGVLTVTVPKDQEKKVQGRFIQITG